ncbi:MAG: hypothetical protein IH870_04390 [Chloroflexi bacterium]|nr:hypothetical protein [Chloroflexota bacterium]
MLKGLDPHIEEQLRRAEEAESEVNRLGSLAAEAPRLRIELARSQRRNERNGNSQTAREQARREIAAAKERQADVPLTLETVSKLVYSLYSLLKDVDAHRKEALRLMGIVDRMDYEEALEAGEDEQKEMGRDPKGIEYLIASRHGQPRIKQMVDDLDPDFNFLRNCDLDEPLRRDVANFIMAHVVSPERANQERATASAAVSQDRSIPQPSQAPAISPNGSPE